MKSHSLLMTLLFLSGTASTALADGKVQVDLISGGFAGGGSGGAFKITHVNGFNGKYGGPGGSASTFLTFCLEIGETFSPGGQYWTEISDKAVFGAGGATGSPSSDPLSSRTALMYYTFRTSGAFGNYLGNPLYVDGTDSAKAKSLQEAIWKSEGESLTLDSVGQAMYDWAQEATDGDLIDDISAFTGGKIGNVRVLQLWTHETLRDWDHRSQDMLTIIPLPGAAGLASIGLMGVAFTRRRMV